MTEVRHPAADPGCPTCHGLGLTVVAEEGIACAVPCACRASTCPVCRGAGFVQDGPGFRAPVRACACREVAARAARFDLVRIPAHYAGATFASFDDRPSLGLGLAKTQSEALVSRWPGNRRGILWFGDVGRGKTHLALATLRELVLRRGTTARFVEFTHLLTDLKLSFEGRGDSASLVEPLYKVDVLLIDELGKGRCTEFEHTVLDDLVSRRYNAGLTILATTNFDPKLPATGQPVANLARATGPDGAAALRPSLRDRVDPRVFSRLQEMCDFLPVSGPDHREQAGRPRRATTRT